MKMTFRAFGTRTFSIQRRIQQDLLSALKAKDTSRASLLKQLQAELINHTKRAPIKGDVASPLADEVGLFGVLRGCAERWQKAIDEYKRLMEVSPARANDIAAMVQKEEAELEVINGYLPLPYSASELNAVVDEAVAELGAQLTDPSKQLGTVISAAMGRLDPTRVTRKELASAVRQRLTSTFVNL
jgi:uncharacterized protein YqeY